MDSGPHSDNVNRCLLEQLRHHRLSSFELWIKYVGLGGNLDELEVEAHVYSLMPVPELDHLLLSEAVRELLTGPR